MRQRTGPWQLQKPPNGRGSFLPIKSYFEVRPVFTGVPAEYVTMAALFHCLLALRQAGMECRAQGEKGDVQALLRQLESIWVGYLQIAGKDSKRLLTQIPPQLNLLLDRLGFLTLFAQPPAWASKV